VKLSAPAAVRAGAWQSKGSQKSGLRAPAPGSRPGQAQAGGQRRGPRRAAPAARRAASPPARTSRRPLPGGRPAARAWRASVIRVPVPHTPKPNPAPVSGRCAAPAALPAWRPPMRGQGCLPGPPPRGPAQRPQQAFSMRHLQAQVSIARSPRQLHQGPLHPGQPPNYPAQQPCQRPFSVPHPGRSGLVASTASPPNPAVASARPFGYITSRAKRSGRRRESDASGAMPLPSFRWRAKCVKPYLSPFGFSLHCRAQARPSGMTP
jgi:hypothetical protein